jgi:hypothetical protein
VTEAQAARHVNLSPAGLKCLRRLIELEATFGKGHPHALQAGSTPSALSKHYYTERAAHARGGVALYQITDTGRAAVRMVGQLTGARA